MKKKAIVICLILLLMAISGCMDLEENSQDVRVLEVVDGDTLEIEWDNGTEDTVRILGIDTPETYGDVDLQEWEGISNESWLKSCGHRATNFTKNWIEDDVTLQFDENEGRRGYYGRVLAYVELDNGTDLGAELIKHGWARVYDEGDCSRESEYLDMEDNAREEGKGVWST